MKRKLPEQNPQDWLPIGQHIRTPDNMYSPVVYNAEAEDCAERLHDGQIVEHLANGAVAVKFDRYPHTTDYTAAEARQFNKTF